MNKHLSIVELYMYYKTVITQVMADVCEIILEWNSHAKLTDIIILINAYLKSMKGERCEPLRFYDVAHHRIDAPIIILPRLNRLLGDDAESQFIELNNGGRAHTLGVSITANGKLFCEKMLSPLIAIQGADQGLTFAAKTLDEILLLWRAYRCSSTSVQDMAILLAASHRGAADVFIPVAQFDFSITRGRLNNIITRMQHSLIENTQHQDEKLAIRLTQAGVGLVVDMGLALQKTTTTSHAFALLNPSPVAEETIQDQKSEWQKLTEDFVRPYLKEAISKMSIPDYHEAKNQHRLPGFIAQEQSILAQKTQYDLLRACAYGLIGNLNQ